MSCREGGGRVRLASLMCPDSDRRHRDAHPVVDEGLPRVLQLLDEPVGQVGAIYFELVQLQTSTISNRGGGGVEGGPESTISWWRSS